MGGGFNFFGGIGRAGMLGAMTKETVAMFAPGLRIR